MKETDDLFISFRCSQTLHNLETRPDNIVSQAVIADLLYGKLDGSELESSFDIMEHYAVLEKWTAKQWSDTLVRFVRRVLFLSLVNSTSKLTSSFPFQLAPSRRHSQILRRRSLHHRRWKALRRSRSQDRG